MGNTKPNHAKIDCSNAIGIISENRVIIHVGKQSNVIRIDAIKKINLVKKRRFEANLAFMGGALLLGGLLVYNLHLELIIRQLAVVLITAAIALGVFYKSYLYQIIIDLDNQKTFRIRAGSLRKEQLKHFYYSIRRKLNAGSTEK